MLTAEAPTADLAAADDAWYAAWRARELSRLAATGITYLDYAGAALAPESLIRADAERLTRTVLGNPHSEHGPSLAATEDLDRARAAILAHLNADPAEYAVVLTANASGACRLVGESYRWGAGHPFVVAADDHNSVNGMAEFARRGGSDVRVLPIDGELRLPAVEMVRECLYGTPGGLFAFPAQSNFSGVRHPLELITAAQEAGQRVLLDAAALLPTSTLDLGTVHPDFVVLSIYKITGYPTGIGALVVRWEALEELRRPWFAGGTVEWVAPVLGRHLLRHGVEGFEDGTPPFLTAGAVPAALVAIDAARGARWGRHFAALAGQFLTGAKERTQRSGAPMIRMHGPDDPEARGATFAFTLLDRRGRALPYWEAEAAAREAGLALRGGCFCNPGCAERAFGLHPALLEPCLDALGPSFTIPRLSACLGGAPVGALRVSLGLGSVAADVDRALDVLARIAECAGSF